ncbi:hypothetical protein [Pyxidicoccus trucidator]|uniref:hypothetical protein n=1 Tax=Pyxidicoccus trucidator TaxID=2709662 RepID=UPI0013DB3E8E|nr:hypothetical protein [Pyxidicoccus trucidator]
MRARLLATCGNGAEDVRAAFDASPLQGSDVNLFVILLLESREVVTIEQEHGWPARTPTPTGPPLPGVQGGPWRHHDGMSRPGDSKWPCRARSAVSFLAAWLVLGVGLVSTDGEAARRGRRGREPKPERLQLATRPYDGTFLSMGLNLGMGGDEPEAADELFPTGNLYPVLGVEASMVKLNSRDLVWLGGYVDLVHSLPNRATRMSLGPEVGWGPIGLDLGVVGELSRGRFGGGFQVRGLLTIAYVAGYASFQGMYDPQLRGFRESTQVGLLLKLPFVMEITGDSWSSGR